MLKRRRSYSARSLCPWPAASPRADAHLLKSPGSRPWMGRPKRARCQGPSRAQSLSPAATPWCPQAKQMASRSPAKWSTGPSSSRTCCRSPSLCAVSASGCDCTPSAVSTAPECCLPGPRRCFPAHCLHFYTGSPGNSHTLPLSTLASLGALPAASQWDTLPPTAPSLATSAIALGLHWPTQHCLHIHTPSFTLSKWVSLATIYIDSSGVSM